MKITQQIIKPAISLFALSAVLLSWTWGPSAQGATSASPLRTAAAFHIQKIKFPPITISINFGRKKKGVCNSGFGVCSITLGKLSSAPRSVSAELVKVDDGRLELRLLEKAPEEGQTLFVDEDITLSAEIAQKLGVKSATIHRGEYAFSANKSVVNARLTK